NIGTAKPTPEEMGGIPHHMLDVVSPFEDYSVARYVEDATSAVEGILLRGKLPIIVGGTGLYIESLVAGRVFAPNDAESLRGELEARYDKLGGERMLAELASFDPVSARHLHKNDKKRIIRAFEIYELTGQTIVEHDEQTKALPPRYDAFRIALDYTNREQLYARIDARVDEMMDNGFLGEAKILLKMGLTKKYNSMQAIGYKEMLEAALGEIWLTDAVESVKRRSRQYAKRQLTWLRRREDVKWITWENTPDYDWGVYISTKYLENEGYI
ncbi:MAG: tRNA (adenosine(37)-N6)-dimethylallyltransferase MiaA, partial [Oscillospiraceae bacterium]|nr:tRNA (adenosine(37)-N6)-dimethylallyltransferase MiaA [Oscillospiraceae bacterium]